MEWIVTTTVLLIFLVVYLIHLLHRVCTAGQSCPSHTLYLRRLKQSGAKMLGGNETDNIFLEEYNLLTDLIFPILDVTVMKHLDKDIPLLSKQEQLHAKMHNEGKAERKRCEHRMARWGWFVFLADLFLLRLGEEISLGVTGFAEATSGVWFYLPMVLPFTKGFMSDEYAYHAVEELEHGPLTTQYLRTKVFPLTPLLCFPVGQIIYFVYFLLPPIMVLAFQPGLLLSRKTYWDLAMYYCTFIPTFLATTYANVMYWVLPFQEDQEQHDRRYQFFLDLVKARGIEYDIVDEATYVVDMRARLFTDADKSQ